MLRYALTSLQTRPSQHVVYTHTLGSPCDRTPNPTLAPL